MHGDPGEGVVSPWGEESPTPCPELPSLGWRSRAGACPGTARAEVASEPFSEPTLRQKPGGAGASQNEWMACASAAPLPLPAVPAGMLTPVTPGLRFRDTALTAGTFPASPRKELQPETSPCGQPASARLLQHWSCARAGNGSWVYPEMLGMGR